MRPQLAPPRGRAGGAAREQFAPNSTKETERLLDAAVALFGERGYIDTTMDQIAERAGVSTGTLYSRFKNKSELLDAVVRRDAQTPSIAVWVTLTSIIVPMLFASLFGT